MTIQKYYFGKLFHVMLFCTIVLNFLSCKKSFNTDTTDDDLLELTLNHSIVRVMPSAVVNLSWNDITVENFKEYQIERKTVTDTAWTKVTKLTDAFQISYVDTIIDDDDLIYRIGIADTDDNILWGTANISIPRTTSVLIPDVFETIQPAFNHGIIDDGDSIIVKPGTYIETLYIAGKDVLIKSTEGYKTTFLNPTPLPDSLDQLRVVNISSGILNGFSVQYGEPMHGSGGGISLGKNATVQNCYVNSNIAQSNENSAGGGVFVRDNGNLYNNIISYNRSYLEFAHGIYIVSAHGEIINNTIVGNDIVIKGDCAGLLFRNNIVYNSRPDISFFDQASQMGVTVDYSLFDFDIGFGSNNIFENPQFSNNGFFQLAPSSPGIDAGHPDNKYLDTDGSLNDLGAYGGPSASL